MQCRNKPLAKGYTDRGAQPVGQLIQPSYRQAMPTPGNVGRNPRSQCDHQGCAQDQHEGVSR
ncbi:hypothetical protein Pres01_47880 [Metapseudomonas resinovorans]|nr:hypothetical protein Pres01_47880 [Pseudomonas resinovorans]